MREFSMLSHTPPRLPIGSIGREPPQMKRLRNNSISGRLRSASELFEVGAINHSEKGRLKDLIISEDPKVSEAIQKYDQGDLDADTLKSLLTDGSFGHKNSLDMVEELSLDVMNFGERHPDSLGSIPNNGMFRELFSMDDEHGWEGAGSFGGNSLGSNNLEPTFFRRDGTKSRNNSIFLGTPPSELFDFDAFPGDGLGGYMDMGNPNMKDQLLELEEYTDSLSKNQINGSLRSQESLVDSPNRTFKPKAPEPGSNSATSNPIGIPSPTNTKVRTSSSSPGSQRKVRPNPQVPNTNNQRNEKTTVESKPKVNVETSGTSSVQMKETMGDATSGSGQTGAYSPQTRKAKVENWLAKRQNRVWKKTVKYDVRKNFADSRLRVKGRFVKKEDEELLRDLMLMTM